MKTRRAAHAWAIGMFLSMVTVTGGCYIEHGNGPWDDDWEGGTGGYGPAGICVEMCDHLVSCGAIDPELFDACADGCNAKHASTPYVVETGCTCVIEAGCADLGAYQCPGAPLPDPSNPGNTGAGGYGSASAVAVGAGGYETSSSSGGVGGMGGWEPVGCTADCDCPSGSSCISGTCKVACVASCECPTGQSCISGYCEAPPAPQISCQVDCDCPSGQVCTAGVCAPN